ncbi:hypothetical protein AB0O31_18360 [Kitasatospora cineracea]|uniref:hypothetical protein n=1 Tax=Kitasatospora cineracea TaxID=88074 RepID=UPI00344428BD
MGDQGKTSRSAKQRSRHRGRAWIPPHGRRTTHFALPFEVFAIVVMTLTCELVFAPGALRRNTIEAAFARLGPLPATCLQTA